MRRPNRVAIAWGLLGLSLAIVAQILLGRDLTSAGTAGHWLAAALAGGAALALIAWIIIERNRRK